VSKQTSNVPDLFMLNHRQLFFFSKENRGDGSNRNCIPGRKKKIKAGKRNFLIITKSEAMTYRAAGRGSDVRRDKKFPIWPSIGRQKMHGRLDCGWCLWVNEPTAQLLLSKQRASSISPKTSTWKNPISDSSFEKNLTNGGERERERERLLPWLLFSQKTGRVYRCAWELSFFCHSVSLFTELLFFDLRQMKRKITAKNVARRTGNQKIRNTTAIVRLAPDLATSGDGYGKHDQVNCRRTLQLKEQTNRAHSFDDTICVNSP
jgi:hypothetical protein